MIEFFTVFIIIFHVISVFQRKGIEINFNKLQIALTEDIVEILQNREETKGYSVESIMKKMVGVSIFFYLCYFSYFVFAFFKEIISLEILIVSITTVLISLFSEIIFYRKMTKNSLLKNKFNTILSTFATINLLVQVAIIINITLTVFA